VEVPNRKGRLRLRREWLLANSAPTVAISPLHSLSPKKGEQTAHTCAIALFSSTVLLNWRLCFVSGVCFQFPVTHQTVMLITAILRTQEGK